MNCELISIIVPVYNVEVYLEKCLNSIINQTYGNIEIILINDGSTDNSGKICDKYAKIDERVVVIHKENGGVSSARNAGLKVAKGNFVGFVDPDDWIAEDMYEKLYLEIKKFNANISVCKFKRVMDRKNFIKRKNCFDAITLNSIDSMYFMLTSIEGYGCAVWNKLYRVDFLKRNSIFTTNSMISEDVSFELQEVYFANKIVSLPVITYNYYRRGISANSLSSNLSYLDKRSDVLIDVFNRYIVKRKFGVECETILVNYVLLLLYDAGVSYTDKKAYLALVEKMYSNVLKYSSVRIIVCNNSLSIRQKMCALIMLLPSKHIRAGYIRLLSKIGQFKRFILSHHG